MHNFHTRSSYDFMPVEGPVGRLAGSMVAPTCQIAHYQVLPGKHNTMVHSRASSGSVRPGTSDHTDIPKSVYGIRTVNTYIIVRVFPSPWTRTVAVHEPYGTI